MNLPYMLKWKPGFTCTFIFYQVVIVGLKCELSLFKSFHTGWSLLPSRLTSESDCSSAWYSSTSQLSRFLITFTSYSLFPQPSLYTSLVVISLNQAYDRFMRTKLHVMCLTICHVFLGRQWKFDALPLIRVWKICIGSICMMKLTQNT